MVDVVGVGISGYIAEKVATVLKVNLKKAGYGMPEIFARAIKKIDTDMELSGLETQNSGSTCCLALLQGDRVYFSNTGDSRAILVNFYTINEAEKLELPGQFSTAHVTSDHSCEVPSEITRIK